MNILQVCSAREIGGGERHLVDLAKGLVVREHNVYAAVIPNSPLINDLSFLPRLNIFEVRMRNAADLVSAGRLARFSRSRSIDLIHAHLARDYPLAALASRWAGKPFVLTRHVTFPMKTIHRWLSGRVSRVIAPSASVADALRRQRLFDDSKIVRIPYGIDVDHFSRKRTEKDPTGRSLVGMVGHLSPIKGQEEFLRAAALIASQRSDVDFLIVGEDKSRDGLNRAHLERLIVQLGVDGRVRLVGWLDDVRDILEILDVFVCPSRIEPFGLVMVEAMACGVPVVATRSEGAVEIVDDRVTGRLVPVGAAKALADTIHDLLSDAPERKRLAANALASVRQRFSLERMVDETEQLYSEVLADRNEP